MKRAAFLLAASAASLLIATSALGATTAELASTRVSYTDLNLNTDAGMAALYARLRRASSEVCGRPGIRELKAYTLANACIDRSLAAAVAQVHSNKLGAHHAPVAARLAAR